MSEVQEAREAYGVLKAEADKLRKMREPIVKALQECVEEMHTLWDKKDKASKKRYNELWERKGEIGLEESKISYLIAQYETAADNARKIFDKRYSKRRREEEIRKIHSL